MSYYDVQSWQSPARQASWDQQTPPSRSGKTYRIQTIDKPEADNAIGTSSVMQREDTLAFWLQIDGMSPFESDRAVIKDLLAFLHLSRLGCLSSAPHTLQLHALPDQHHIEYRVEMLTFFQRSNVHLTTWLRVESSSMRSQDETPCP